MKFAQVLHSIALVSAAALIPVTTAGLAAVDGRAAVQFARLNSVYLLVKQRYIDKVDAAKLEDGAIQGMLTSLDPHSSYLSGATMQRLNTMIDGNYSGLGLSVVMDDGAVKVMSAIKSAPAAQAGIKAGDYITHLDGKLIYGGEIDDAVSQMRGVAGTSIRLTIFRPERKQPFDVTIKRAVIALEAVTSELQQNIGVIAVNEFSSGVSANVAKSLEELRRQAGGKLAVVVLDLRENPGGELEEAVGLS